MRKKSFTIFTESIAQVSAMSDADAGALFKAVLRYSLDGTEPQSGTLVHFAFLQFKQQIDEEDNRRKEISEKRKEAIQSRWERVQMNTNEYNCIELNTNVSPDTSPVPQQPKQKKPKADPEAIAKRQEAKKEDFYNGLVPFVSIYGKEMVRAFFDYWTEPNKSKTKMRFELEKTWDLKRRLNTWATRDKIPSNNINNATNRPNTTEQRATGAASIVAKLLAENNEATD